MDRFVRNLSAAALLLCLSLSPSWAMMKTVVNFGPPRATYIGPGDVVAGATFFMGLRGYNGAYAAPGTGKSIRYRRASDNAEQDGLIKTDGSFDVSAANTFAGTDASCTGTIATGGGIVTMTITSCASGTLHVNDTVTGTGIVQPAFITSIDSCGSPPGTCKLNSFVSQTVVVGETITAQVAMFVSKGYDQSGNAFDVTQTTAGNQCQLLPNGSNGLPGMYCDGVSQGLSNNTVTNLAQQYTRTLVLNNIIFNNSSRAVMGGGATTGLLYSNASASANVFGMYAGAPNTAAATDLDWHVASGVFNGASSKLTIDGTTTTGDASTGASGGGTAGIFIANGDAVYWSGRQRETGLWPSGFSTGNISAMCTNMSAYWGITASC